MLLEEAFSEFRVFVDQPSEQSYKDGASVYDTTTWNLAFPYWLGSTYWLVVYWYSSMLPKLLNFTTSFERLLWPQPSDVIVQNSIWCSPLPSRSRSRWCVLCQLTASFPGERLMIASGLRTVTILAKTLSLSGLRATNAQGFVQRRPLAPTLLGLAMKAVPAGWNRVGMWAGTRQSELRRVLPCAATWSQVGSNTEEKMSASLHSRSFGTHNQVTKEKRTWTIQYGTIRVLLHRMISGWKYRLFVTENN